MGYSRAGFDVVGVDVEQQPHYPFDFIQADALAFLRGVILENGGGFAAIHASPPCQAYSSLKVMHNAKPHPDLIEPTRKLLIETGVPYVIENVVGSPLVEPIKLCGTMFELGITTHDLRRHRLFESNIQLQQPACKHTNKATIGIYGDHARDRRRGPNKWNSINDLKYARAAMGIDWMNWKEITQAIPPAYTEYIGRQLLSALNG